MLSRLFSEQATWQALALGALPTLVVAWLAARATRRLAARMLRGILGNALAESSPLVQGPLRLLGAAVFVLVLGLLLVPALELAGLQPKGGLRLSVVTGWLFGPGLRVIVIALLAYASIRATGLVVLGVATLMILQQFNIDITPVLTGAGIAGLAVGFGAQALVRDVISGFFLLLEDQVRVGDVAAINGTAGLVEQLNLRTIVLRDGEGTVHVFPNGAITTLANRSKDFSYYMIDLPVAYDEDPDRISAILAQVGAALQADAKLGPFILAPLEINGVDAFADWWMVVKMRIKTMPLKQWAGPAIGLRLRPPAPHLVHMKQVEPNRK